MPTTTEALVCLLGVCLLLGYMAGEVYGKERGNRLVISNGSIKYVHRRGRTKIFIPQPTRQHRVKIYIKPKAKIIHITP